MLLKYNAIKTCNIYRTRDIINLLHNFKLNFTKKVCNI